MDARLLTAVVSAKLLKLTIKTTGGGATAAPGLLAEYIDPAALRKLAKYYQGAILVTGTNGKTTTSRLLGNVLKEAKIPFIHNRAGSNLLRGLVGTLVDNFNPWQPNKNLALLEVDEATLPTATNATNPKVIIFNNLFRDQLDRYGEVDKIRKIWQKALLHLDASTVLALNSDDHSVANLASATAARSIYFGIEDASLSLGALPHASDFTSCIACGGDLTFDEVYLSHLGKYKCNRCGLTRPKPDVAAEQIFLQEEEGFVAKIKTPKGTLELKAGLPGIYNVYNVLAAVSAALALGIGLSDIKKALEDSLAAFGRTERIDLEENKSVFIALVKNPAGFNEILRTLFTKKEKKFVLIAINDLIADGRDVSWLWDVDFEVLAGKIKKLMVSGLRANDMALRIKYSGCQLEPEVVSNLEEAIETAVEKMPVGQTLYILPTYTAMLSLKKFFAEKGNASRFWED